MKPRGLGLPLGGALVLAWALAGDPSPAAAQSDELARAEAAMERGRFGEARERVERWWEGPGPTAAGRDDRQRALWLRARLTVDPEMAELDFRRLVLEYPQGLFSDQALLRLAQGAEARRDIEAARRYLEILLRDYPASAVRPEARSRLARLPEGTPAASPGATRSEAAAPETGGAWAVQLGAFTSEEAAGALAQEARTAGLGVRVVRVEGSPLFRVRLGSFATREEAEAEVRRAAERGFAGFVSGDRERERPAEP